MAAKIRILEYEIHLTDAAQVDALNAQFPNGLRVAPATAATTYSAPIAEYASAFSSPSIRSPWFWFTPPTNYPRDQAVFNRCSGGWFGVCFLFGNLVGHIWSGRFVYTPSTTAAIDGTPTEVVAMAQRRFLNGFETPVEGENPSPGTETRSSTRDASRHIDGLGWAFRGDTGSRLVTLNSVIPGGSTARNHWDRFYIRVRKAPTASSRIWLSNGGNGNDGIAIDVLGSLVLAISNVASGTATLLTSTTQTLTVDTWVRIDIVLSYATGAAGAGAFVKVHMNGVLVASISSFGATGLGSQGAYLTSRLGSQSNNTLEADFDDWMGAAEPTKESVSPFRYVGLDWLNGSKILRVQNRSFSASHDAVNWSNQSYSNLNGFTDGAQVTPMASTTALCTMETVTEGALAIDAQANSLGIAAMVLAVYHSVAGAGNTGALGWTIEGGALDSLALVNQTGAGTQHYLYRPTGVSTPIKPIGNFAIRYVKANNANNDQVSMLTATVEMIGTFGPEDVPRGAIVPDTIPTRALGPHNMPYPQSPWARLIKGPAAPYIIHSGTYTGNGTGQDLLFRLPVHWFFTRRTGTATRTPQTWFSAGVGPRSAMGTLVETQAPVEAFIDPSFVGTGAQDTQEQRTILRITGADPESNEAGVTYQFVAVSDPLGRFMLSGGLHHGAVDSSNANALPNTNFLPEAMWLNSETPAGGTATAAFFYKGLGHALSAASLVNSAETADIFEFTAGNIQSKDASTISAVNPMSYTVWRRQDGSTDPGIPKCLQLGSYIGDGTASRTVSYGPTGVRPLFLLVVPHTAAVGIIRDPSCTGTTSYSATGGVNNASTGITGGAIDSFSVGSVLNTNGVVFDWFLLPGSATAGNNGWSVDGEFIPVEPDTPFDGPFDTTEPDEGVDPDPTDPTAPPDDTDDCAAGTVCVDTTTSQINTTLLELGVLQFLTNYCTQQTKEAQIARLLYEVSVRAVLHAYPWPFATKYAALTLSATQPANQDWTYAYLVPTDCIFERRLVTSRGTVPADNPTPPPFMLSSISSGGILYTNEPNAVLEYTFRPACVAFNGDDLYREALKFHLAAAMAPALTRMAGEAERCYAKYEACIEKANAIKKPGVPGLRPAAATIDTVGACVLANLDVANRGLMRIGARTIASLATDQSREAVAVNLVFEQELRATLRDYSWKFAKRYNESLTLVGGTATDSVNPDWQYSYRLPTNCLKVRRIVKEGFSREFDRDPIKFEVGTDTTGGLLFTDFPPPPDSTSGPQIEYTERIDCACNLADSLFRDAFAWRLAFALAPSLAQVDAEEREQDGRGPDAPPNPLQRISHKPNKAAMRQMVAQRAYQMYRAVLAQAEVADANESQPEPPGEAEWIDGRN